MTLIATISLFIGTRSAWTQAMLAQPSPPGPPPSPRTTVYVVRSQGGHRALPTSTDQHMYLIAVTGSPMTISTASLGNATHPG
ncbi:hypothetical protein ACOT81_43310 [Streptomyces sp. WI04-05B]|uniref:hypothetical protein n=1 Tax=Streptomyces TaxID=1883 RepID=UPI0029AA6DB2|nr:MULTISPECIES: hypothetical protein [unclassified Streptomyces]MDX2543354.1 hypothetical protein [Streptomyces sp. WI04-05B]MDX2586756.1 hypothetical protein [Streptomyces sp. WI04-05A]